LVKVKICGITNEEDALNAVALGADAVGFILYCKSKRYVEPKVVRKITSLLPPFVSKVGVFVNENPRNILEVMSYAGLDFAQLHGDETPQECEYVGRSRVIKAFRVKDFKDVDKMSPFIGKVRAILLDTYSPDSYGGTGKSFNWEIAKRVKELYSEVPLILSGGLNPENVKRAVESVRPYAVDVSSGVEERIGKKNRILVEQFILSAKCSK